MDKILDFFGGSKKKKKNEMPIFIVFKLRLP